MGMPAHATAIAAIGSSSDELGQALALLRSAHVADPEAMLVAEGDRRLLEIHRALCGRDVEVAVQCEACGATNVATLTPTSVPPAVPRSAWVAPGAGLRQPTYGDLLGLPHDPSKAQDELVARCTIGTPAAPVALEQLERVDDALTGPVVLTCVDCGALLEAAADVQQLVLEGLQRCALQLDRELHLLAREYGWSLADIESLPDDRRRRLAGLVAEGR